MSQSQQQIIKVQIHHQLIGNHNFELSGKTHTSDLRLHILENSPLYIHENFHLEHQGGRLPDCNEISEIFKGDVRLTVIFDLYDEYSSRYHQMKVRKILASPAQWAVVNSRDYSSKIVQDEKEEFPSLSLDGLFENPFSSILLERGESKQNDFSNLIHSSGFNPPSHQRKLLGDLYYLHIRTLQEVDFHISANSEGFFVNQSTQSNFNPHPNPKYSSCISLLELLFQVSPKFKSKFQEVLKGVKVSEFQRLSQGEKVMNSSNDWMVESGCWKKNNSWKNDAYLYSYKNDYTVIKDWVQIFQYQQTSSSDTLFQKIGKQKLRYRIYQEFIESVRDCVLRIFNGTMKPLNVTPNIQHRIYYYSGLLFYFVNDGLKKDSSLPSGYSANKELLTLGLLEYIDTDNVCLSHSAVVTYRGFKVVAKAVPSCLIKSKLENNTVKDIFWRDNKAQSDELILGALRKISKSLGLESEILTVGSEGAPKMVCVNPSITGCVSHQTKRFILETKGFSVQDLNFDKEELGECYLRPELIKIYNSHQKCQILYNSNIGTSCTLSNTEKHKQQLKKLQSVAKFAKQIMVPSLVDSFDGEMRKYLSDSHNVVYALHKFGLSSKYLGLVYHKATEKQAQHVKIMIERVILVRSLKGLFKKALRSTPLFLHKTVLKNLLNCLFEEEEKGDLNHKDIKTDDETDLNGNGKKYNKKKKMMKDNQTFFQISFGKSEEKYCTIKKKQFWEETKQIAAMKFKHALNDLTSFFVFQFSKVAILRDLCLCLGVVLEKKDYFATERSTTFIEDNIVNLTPKIKVVGTESNELNDLMEEGDRQTNKFQIQQAFEAYNKAFQYVFSSFGEIHQKLGLMYKKFAGLHYKIGDLDAAVLFALNSHEIYEHLGGKDNVEAIEALMMVGVYEFGRKRFAAAQYYMLKAIFLAKLAYSECYPEVMVMHMNISTVYEAQRKYTDAIMSLFLALNISIRVYGQTHLHTAIIFSALASLHYDIPDIEQTIKFQQRSISILEELLGSCDERVVEAKNTCEGYKNIQNSKKIREVHEKEQRSLYGLPSLGKFNMKTPFYDMRERGTADFFWKKSRRLKYFF